MWAVHLEQPQPAVGVAQPTEASEGQAQAQVTNGNLTALAAAVDG